MTCCVLEKRTIQSTLPAHPALPANPGSPAIAGYYSTAPVTSCSYTLNPAVSYFWQVVQAHTTTVPPVYYGLAAGYYAVIATHYYGPYPTLAAAIAVYGPQYIYSCHTTYVTTWHPPVAAVPATLAQPAAPAQMVVNYNLGWNSWSRSVLPLVVGDQFVSAVASGAAGVFIAVDEVGKEGLPLTSFPLGLMVDGNGVTAFLNGHPDTTLLPAYTGLTELYIRRNVNGTLTVAADAQEKTIPSWTSGDLYIYVYMYSGGDRITCAAYSAITGTNATCGMYASGSLNLAPPRVGNQYLAHVQLDGDSDLLAGYAYLNTAPLSATSSLSAVSSALSVSAAMAPVISISSEFDFIAVVTDVPGLTCTAYDLGTYIPPKSTTCYANVQALAFSGFMQSIEIDSVEADLSPLVSLSGMYNYTFVDTTMAPLAGFCNEGVVLEMQFFSGSILYDTQAQQAELVLVLNSDGILQSVYVDSIVKVQEYLSALLVASQFSLIGTYGVSQLSALTAMSLQAQAVAGHAALDDVGRVWVVNMESAASTQYSNYGFNSFFVRNGESYGVADDGIYRLSGVTDLLEPIDAQINLGSTRLGVSHDKLLPAVYINAASDGKLIMKVEVDGADPYYYEARSSSETLDNHRVDTGRGLKGNNWTFTLMNQDGDDFELANLEFVPLQGSRRI
jgi:hypothetical protein